MIYFEANLQLPTDISNYTKTYYYLINERNKSIRGFKNHKNQIKYIQTYKKDL